MDSPLKPVTLTDTEGDSFTAYGFVSPPQFTESNTFRDSGLLLEHREVPRCYHGEWIREPDEDPHTTVYACAKNCGTRLRVTLRVT
jgi:hypothetical protein